MKKYLSVIILFAIAFTAVAALHYVTRNRSSQNAKAAGNTLYASPNGGGSNCTNASPCSLQTGFSQTGAGDTLILLDGTYSVGEGFRWQSSGGSESTRPTMKAQSFRGATILCDGSEGGGINWDGAWQQVEDIRFKWCAFGIGAPHVRLKGIENGYANGNAYMGLEENEPTYTELINNYVHHAGKKDNATWWTICDNQSSIFSGDCHSLYWAGDNVLIDGGMWTASNFNFHIRSGNTATGWVVRNVIFTRDTGAPVGGCNFLNSADGMVFYNNIFMDMPHCANEYGSNHKFYNNTFYNVDLPINRGTNYTVQNNIFSEAEVAIGPEVSGSFSNNLTSNPMFVNAAGGDFHLTTNSPAIDKGMALAEVTTDADRNTRPAGGAYDIGAYEFGATGGCPVPSGAPLPSGVQPSAAISSFIAPIYVTPTVYCLGACPSLPVSPSPIGSITPLPSLNPSSSPSCAPVSLLPTQATTGQPLLSQTPGQQSTPMPIQEPADQNVFQQLLDLINQLIAALRSGLGM